ncbi:MAG: LysR family transcriptional regulator [Burkholderiaceae bacterium]|nr:LysR family transcriptional regulator [Burkholderiaceae bacterium]
MQDHPRRLPPLDLLLAFEAVARHGSVTRGAAERFITQSAMSRQIQALEDELGTALFLRRHRALELTEAGRRLQAACAQALEPLRDIVAELRAPPAREWLAVTTTPSFASLWLIPRLAGFTREHPGLDVRLDASFERRDLRRDGFDLAVRYARDGASEGQRLFGEAIVPVCGPQLLADGEAPLRTPADLAGHTLLQVLATPGATASGMPVDWESWLAALGLPQVRPRATLQFSSYNEAVAAAVAGQGLVLGRRPLVDGLIAEGRLCLPFGVQATTAWAYHLVLEPTAAQRPAVQALVQWLLQACAAAQA